MDRTTSKLTISITEAAERLGISRNLAYEAARRGDIPTIKIGKRLLVPITTLDRLLANGNRTLEPVAEN